MRDRRLVVPTRFIAATLHRAVDKVLHARLDRLVDHRVALSNLAFVGHALALRNLHAVDSPNGSTGGLCGVLEEARHVVHVALDELDVVGFTGELLRRAAGGVSGHCQEGEGAVACHGIDHAAALLASGSGDEDVSCHCRGSSQARFLIWVFSSCMPIASPSIITRNGVSLGYRKR